MLRCLRWLPAHLRAMRLKADLANVMRMVDQVVVDVAHLEANGLGVTDEAEGGTAREVDEVARARAGGRGGRVASRLGWRQDLYQSPMQKQRCRHKSQKLMKVRLARKGRSLSGGGG
mmetsp:Transcript_145/g.369  ORF Transcript_145/g.369 Transcript_145/m.369 type:complete len:117 (-) Transcript_145:251-601(-)